MAKPKTTMKAYEKADMKKDRRMGVKEESARDKRMDTKGMKKGTGRKR